MMIGNDLMDLREYNGFKFKALPLIVSVSFNSSQWHMLHVQQPNIIAPHQLKN